MLARNRLHREVPDRPMVSERQLLSESAGGPLQQGVELQDSDSKPPTLQVSLTPSALRNYNSSTSACSSMFPWALPAGKVLGSRVYDLGSKGDIAELSRLRVGGV